jgi:isopentenyl diphosphate isomerase/L-lactate dehydrogenase-like FMN-dependent dehydrogenase
MDAFRTRLAGLAAGDQQAQQAFALGVQWLQEANSGLFRSWDDLAFLRANWDGPIVLKGIQTVETPMPRWTPTWMASSNHGACSFPSERARDRVPARS